jgi:hypothetical protein
MATPAAARVADSDHHDALKFTFKRLLPLPPAGTEEARSKRMLAWQIEE